MGITRGRGYDRAAGGGGQKEAGWAILETLAK